MFLIPNRPVYISIGSLLTVIIQFSFALIFQVKAQSNQVVSNGSFTQPIVYPSGSCGYTWTNSNSGIGLPANGTGDIASFRAINTGTSSVTATITATPVSAPLAYVANSGSNDVSVFNTATKTIVATIPVGRNPFGAAVSPNGRTVYITNKDDASVTFIDVYTNTAVSTVLVASKPQGIAASPDGNYLYVACGNANSISVIDVSAKTVIANISVGQDPYGVIFNPNGTRAYVTNNKGNSVSVINTVTGNVISTINIGANPAGLVTSADGNTVYVAMTGANKLTIINALSNLITKEITVSNNPVSIVINPLTSRIAMVGISGFMNIVDPITNYVIGTPSPGAQGMAFTPDYSAFYYTDKINNRLSYTAANFGSGGIISPFGNGPTSFGNFIAPGPPCNMPTVKFTIRVDPSPNIQLSAVTGHITACAGSPSSSSDIQQFQVSGNGLNSDINIVAPASFEISLNSGSGFGNTLILPATSGSVSPTTVFVRSSSTAVSGNLTGNVVCTSTGAVAQQATVSAAINPQPSVNIVSNQTLSAGGRTTAINFSGTASVYSWVNNTPGIGLAANGNGPISSFTAVNTTQAPLTATVTVTPSSGNCSGVATTFNITVNPAPVITANSTLPVTATIEFGNTLSSRSFTVSGLNLLDRITVAAPAGFEISLDDINFTETTLLGTGSNIPVTPVYFRLKPGAATGTYSGNIALSSQGAANVNVAMPNITITPAPLTIAADDRVKQYGEVLSNNTSSAAFKITSGILKNGNTLNTVMINYGAGASGNSGIGPYQITPTTVNSGGNGFAAGNYSINWVDGTLTVLPAPLTIAADDNQKIQNALNPTLTFTYSGFVNNENETVLNVKPTITTMATTTSPVGSYPINVTGAVAPNYTITYVDALLTVIPAPLSIVPPNAFTPNGDGINDTWEIPALVAYPKCTVKIYSRSGQLVFQSTGYAKPWDGSYGITQQPVGAYYYIIYPAGEQRPLSGSVTIVR
ncbi:MBG domain-containing protein [Mucilaginibacter auburnensis]|uniref:Gliding motility-associated-like protein n=1 Tax=Mucilaginibacter auburnensis TaxID=1457233 RepID=A0A2H9VPR8_9SPHI|nr:MBG domain-containing protein [Mucilaginibacter auburnensis]PJJ80290.1 gliding motility-associated-like protein [Mucilaginibacter auburnensis]